MRNLLFLPLFIPLVACTVSFSPPPQAIVPVVLTGNETGLAKVLAGRLVDATGKPVDAMAHLGKAKYTLVYFSAGWCTPCHQFSPTLIKFVEENQAGGNFAVVMVSKDYVKSKMLDYMRDKKMPWPAVFEREADLGDVSSGVRAIPRIRVFDADAKLVMESSLMAGPEKMLEEFKAKLDAEKAAPTK